MRPATEYQASRRAKVVVWDNGENGFGIKIQGPTFKTDNGEWKESAFYATDIPSIMRALQRAMEYVERKEEARMEALGSQKKKAPSNKPEAPPTEGGQEIPF